MKKLLAFLLVIVMILGLTACGSAPVATPTAEPTPESTPEESNGLVPVPAAESEVWYDENGVKIVCTGYGYDITNSRSPIIKFDFQVENNSSKSIWAGISEDYYDGWKIGTGGNFCDNGLDPGRKINSTQKIRLENHGITEISANYNYDFTLWVDLDEEDYHNERILIQKSYSGIPIYGTETSPESVPVAPVSVIMPDSPAGVQWPETWYDDNGVTITCLGYAMDLESSSPKLYFDLTVENNTEKSIWAGISDDYLDGWKIGTTGNFCDNGIAPGTKIRSIETIHLSEAGIADLSQVQTYEFKLWVDLDSDDWHSPRQEFTFTIHDIPRCA